MDELATNEAAWSAAAKWGSTDRMNELEALMWRSERHPRLSSTICVVMEYDTVPDWERFFAAHAWAADLLVRARQRVLEPAFGFGTPAWVPDEYFDLAYHVRRVQAPRPGDRDVLLAIAQSVALRPFDRSRPLWEGLLVEGLAEGRAGYVLKLHHSMTDGLGGIAMLNLVQSRTREHVPNKPTRAVSVPPAHDPVELATAELAADLRRVPELAGNAVATSLRGAANPGLALSESIRYAGSLRRVLSRSPAPPSPLLRRRNGRSWRFGALECDLDALRSAGRKGGGSANDAYLAALLGGMRLYHEAHGVAVDELAVAVPVTLGRDDDPVGGNRFAGAMVAAPVGIADPVERIADVRGAVLSTRTEPALAAFAVVAPVLNRVPGRLGGLLNGLGAAADLAVSSVPGVPHPVYMAGARVERLFPFGPLPGAAMMAVMAAHSGTACIGVNSDAAAIRDHDRFMGCMRAGLAEVLDLADC
jgi:WS/DGAT/MGAT family acyltransferase